MTIFEYVWLDAKSQLRSKIRVSNDDDPKRWNYDGSSTGQATGSDSEVILNPVATYPNPLLTGVLVICETLLPDGSPHPDNTRHASQLIHQRHNNQEPMYGIEQEFFLTGKDDPATLLSQLGQGTYYCGVGTHVLAREVVQQALQNCIRAGINVTGMNAEVAPLQWEIQVCDTGIRAADSLVALRYILERTAEKHGYNVNYDPKPFQGDCNGSGCHVNFSTKQMREPNGYQEILRVIKSLETRHTHHMDNYGVGNDLRMTGKHETASYDKFSYGVANRGASIRIPRETRINGYGYFEDRRPASNMDPYLVTRLILESVVAS